MKMIKAKCTWKVQGDRPVSDAIVHFENDESIDLEDAISAENCVQLEAPMDDDIAGNYIVPACQIFLFCIESRQISSISILSEARVIEVYGYHGEYLSTMKNELMEEVDGLSVFRGDLNLERPVKECCLKFMPLKSKESMWLYGIKIVLQQKGRTTLPGMFPPNIPMKEVEERLNSSHTQISDKAEAFKKLMETFQGASPYMPMMQQTVPGLAFQAQPQVQFPQSVNVTQLLGLLQGMVPPAAIQPAQNNTFDLVQQIAALKPEMVQELYKHMPVQHQAQQMPQATAPVQDQNQEAALTTLAELIRTSKIAEPPSAPVQSPAAPVKTAEGFPLPVSNEVIMEYLAKSELLSKESITAILTDIVKKSGSEFHLHKTLGDAEKPDRIQDDVIQKYAQAQPQSMLDGEKEADTNILVKPEVMNSAAALPHKEVLPEPSHPPVTAAVQTVTEELVDSACQTEPMQEEGSAATPQVTQEMVLDVLKGDLETLFEKMSKAAQEQLLNLLGGHMEELKQQVVEKVEVKIQEMEERVNARFDAIIDALQGQEEEEEIFEQTEEGSSV
ncbi:uncharacterized protein LOC135377644 [Ornithodoros turicata]|uniref:uncharacterized protein LOC135377644 n=1 Tax=Ornithodoros turicata TaxID=34597 RepID=UPI003139F425